MLTRCPQCQTTFRVTPEQIKARQGNVRCGECQSVFNALDTLIEVALPPAPAPQPDQEIQPQDFEPVVEEPSFETPLPMASEPFADEEPPEEPLAAASPAASEPEPVVESVAPVMPEPIAEPVAPIVPEPGLEPLLHERPPRPVWPWSLGIFAASIALAVQAMLHFRTEIAVLYPEAKPLFAAACGKLGCDLALPRKPELMSIEASDLHPDSGGRLTLSATLKNRAPFAQECPYLELTLTDTADRPLVRRVLAPADYLPPKASVAAGFGADSELAVSLAVEAPDIAAAGYRLYLFYP